MAGFERQGQPGHEKRTMELPYDLADPLFKALVLHL